MQPFGDGFVRLIKMLIAPLTLLLGIDRFMSEARALTNFVGNAVATIVVSRWENQLDLERASSLLGMASQSRHPVPREPRFRAPGAEAVDARDPEEFGEAGKGMAP